MIRVLHLCERPADYQTAASLAALRGDGSRSIETEVREIGRGGAHFAPVSAVIALRRAPSRRFDLIHAWGPAALKVAAFGANLPLVYSPSADPHHREVRWLRSILLHRDVHTVCPTDTVRRRFVERGVPIQRCHLIRPGVSFAKARRARNDALRGELGLASDDRVTLAPGESTREADHEHAVFAVTVLNVMDRRNRVLTWGRGPHADSVARFAGRMGRPSHVDARRTLRREIEFEELLSIADDVLITATGSVATLPICTCMAAALPIVATVTPTIAELLEDRHTALFTTRRSPRLIVQRLLDLRENPTLQWQIADMARTEAYEFFTISRFLEQHRTVYQQIMSGETVQIVQPAPGAGLRFHGRG